MDWCVGESLCLQVNVQSRAFKEEMRAKGGCKGLWTDRTVTLLEERVHDLSERISEAIECWGH